MEELHWKQKREISSYILCGAVLIFTYLSLMRQCTSNAGLSQSKGL